MAKVVDEITLNEVLYCTEEQFRENVKSWCYCDLETVTKGAVA